MYETVMPGGHRDNIQDGHRRFSVFYEEHRLICGRSRSENYKFTEEPIISTAEFDRRLGNRWIRFIGFKIEGWR